MNKSSGLNEIEKISVYKAMLKLNKKGSFGPTVLAEKTRLSVAKCKAFLELLYAADMIKKEKKVRNPYYLGQWNEEFLKWIIKEGKK
jgi:predicted transcriptional regulator